MKTRIVLLLFLLFPIFRAHGACDHAYDPMYISLGDAMKQRQFEPACENCEDKLPELGCGWKWIKSYIIDYSNPEQEWRWHSWPDNINLVIVSNPNGQHSQSNDYLYE